MHPYQTDTIIAFLFLQTIYLHTKTALTQPVNTMFLQITSFHLRTLQYDNLSSHPYNLALQQQQHRLILLAPHHKLQSHHRTNKHSKPA